MDLLQMDKKIRALLYKNGRLSNRYNEMKKGLFKLEANAIIAKRFALLKKIEKNHYDTLHKMVSMLEDVNDKNKKLIAKELEDIRREYKFYND